MTTINNSLFTHTSLAASAVIVGVVIKNALEQAKMHTEFTKMAGIFFFVFGWLYIAWIVSLGRKNKATVVIPSILILITAMWMKTFMSRGQMPPMWMPITFAVSWMTLGLASSAHLKGGMRWFGALAGVSVILSMMVSLPWQRKECVVDGPGYCLFCLGWAVVAISNSLGR